MTIITKTTLRIQSVSPRDGAHLLYVPEGPHSNLGGILLLRKSWDDSWDWGNRACGSHGRGDRVDNHDGGRISFCNVRLRWRRGREVMEEEQK